MKILVSAAALVIALAWPTAGDATTTQQQYVRHAKVGVRRGEKPCAARTWAGCQGWDPDPNVRSMIQMDAGRDDY